MEIQLNKKYKIISDKFNFILQCKAEKKDKTKAIDSDNSDNSELGWRSIGFYPTLEILFDDLINMEILGFDAKNLKKVVLLIKDIKSFLKRLPASNFKR